MGPLEAMTPAELASVVRGVSVDVLTTALATFTDRERRALLACAGAPAPAPGPEG